jgi:hypothetical protein
MNPTPCSLRTLILASVIIPRSPTNTTCSIPKLSLTRSTADCNVDGSPVLPLCTSIDTGWPEGAHTSP